VSIDEAIKENEYLLASLFPFLHRDYEKAFKLGIAALKREKYYREHQFDHLAGLLPGETEE